MKKFDLIVIGGGPAGYLAAERAGAAALHTALIEKRALGGVCLNEGCIPSKTLLHSAKIFEYAQHSERYGVTVEAATIDHAAVLARKNKVVKKLVAGVTMKMKAQGVTVFTGTGVIKGRQDDGFCVQVDEEVLIAPKLIIATGSRPVMLPVPGVQEGFSSGFILTNREILDLAEVPNSLVVVGGGAVGLEIASYYRSIGCAVSVVEMLNTVAGSIETEISQTLQRSLQNRGIAFHLDSRVSSIGNSLVHFENQDGLQCISADKVLLAAGRQPVCDGFGLESLGVYTESGAIVTDHCMRTNVADVYAAGDVNGRSMLAHTAYREAEVAINNILGRRDKMHYHAIPSIIYTNPEVACVGETEKTALEKGIPVQTATLPLSYAGRYVAEVDRGEGFCKLIMHARNQTLLGVHIIGSYASEIIYGAALMIEREIPIQDIKKLVFPHPTVSEIIRETLFALE